MEDMTKRIIRKLQVMNDYERESQRFASAVRRDIENLWQTYSFCKQFMYLQELNGDSFV